MNHNENDNKYAKEMYSRYYSLAIGCFPLKNANKLREISVKRNNTLLKPVNQYMVDWSFKLMLYKRKLGIIYM